jgi:tetratricopeptide (TPR) repeat protein
VSRSDRVFVVLPDPGRAGTLDELTEVLRLLKVWAGDPSYDTIKDRINTAWKAAGRPGDELAKRATVAACFKTGRRRLNTDLVIAVVRALHPDVGYVTQWRQALRVIVGEIRAASQVRVQDRLPQDLAGFTGRTAELDRLRRALRHSRQDGGAVVNSAITGMAGVGKTQLAIHAGHLLAREKVFDRVLFVNLRGFHPDPAQPPADPAAVLDGFLRLLGVPGHRIPHNLPARTGVYRDRLAGTRTLVVLDNAADADQVRPLLPETPGCPVLVTSRRSLTALHPATHQTLDVFTPNEALEFLTRAAPQVPVGEDPNAAARIAHRCGHLPLALGLVTGHIRGTPGWTLTDHADRLDERHHQQRLDSGVTLALDLSYQHLPNDLQRLLRLASLHPGQDLDAHAAAALAGIDLPTIQARLHHLCRDHLLQPGTPGRYTLHDLVRAHATGRASDEDPPPERRAALTRLFDYYLATAATAMDTLYPAEAHRRPRIPAAGTPTPALTDPDTARTWLGTERPTLVAVAAHAATHGWPTHTTRLSAILFRYLAGGHFTDALVVHGHAHQAARHVGDPTDEAHALTNLGATHLQLGRYEPAAEHLQQALHLFRQAGDPAGQARALGNLGTVEARLGHYRPADDYYRQALALYRLAGNRTGEADALNNLGIIEARLGHYQPAADYYEQALALCRQSGDLTSESLALIALSEMEARLGHYQPAADYYEQALALCRQSGDLTSESLALIALSEMEARLGRHGPATDHLLQARAMCQAAGDRTGEAWALDSLGTVHTQSGRPTQATDHHQQALTIFRELSERGGQASALNGLGEAAHAAGRPTDAITHHTAAHTIAADIGDRDQQARAYTGLGHAHHILGNPVCARHHYQHALTLYTDLGTPEADQIRALVDP